MSYSDMMHRMRLHSYRRFATDRYELNIARLYIQYILQQSFCLGYSTLVDFGMAWVT